jgi:hypothetical protein
VCKEKQSKLTAKQEEVRDIFWLKPCEIIYVVLMIGLFFSEREGSQKLFTVYQWKRDRAQASHHQIPDWAEDTASENDRVRHASWTIGAN